MNPQTDNKVHDAKPMPGVFNLDAFKESQLAWISDFRARRGYDEMVTPQAASFDERLAAQIKKEDLQFVNISGLHRDNQFEKL